MLSLKSDQPQPAKKLSQSSSDLNQIDSGDVKTETNTTKRKKWYKIFLPPSGTKHLREKVFETLPEINEQERDMRPWYKIKKKKSKVAITSENWKLIINLNVIWILLSNATLCFIKIKFEKINFSYWSIIFECISWLQEKIWCSHAHLMLTAFNLFNNCFALFYPLNTIKTYLELLANYYYLIDACERIKQHMTSKILSPSWGTDRFCVWSIFCSTALKR